MNEAGTHVWRTVVLAGAGLTGAAGVALAAVAAHRVQSPSLGAAAQILMVHAPAVLALAAFSQRSQRVGPWLGVASVMLAGAALFSGEVTLSALSGQHLFPMAAPTGGSLLIFSWLAIVLVALVERRKSQA